MARVVIAERQPLDPTDERPVRVDPERLAFSSRLRGASVGRNARPAFNGERRRCVQGRPGRPWAVYDAGMATIRSRLARPFDTAELRRIKRLWVRHSIAEDRRDIDGLVATMTDHAVYEIVPTGQRWEGLDGVRAFYTELFAAFPDNRFELTDIVIGPQGVFEVATLSGTNGGPWAGAPASGLPVSLRILIHFPWDPIGGRFAGETIYFDRGDVPAG